jgi:PAS domain S-box-containing protein
MFDDRDVIVSHPEKEYVGMSLADIVSRQHEKRGEHFHPNELQDHITLSHGYFNKVRAEDEGGGIFLSCTSGENELVSYKGVKVLDRQWGLVVTLPYQVIAGPINEHARKVFGLAVFIVLLFSAGGGHLLSIRKREAELEAEAKYLKPLAASAEALREGEKRFRELVESSLVGILIIQDGLVVYQNPEQERLFGILPGQFNFSDFQNFHPDDAAKFQDFYQKVSSGMEHVPDLEVRFYPLEHEGSASALRWVLCRASSIYFEGRRAVFVNMVDITRIKELEHLVMTKQKMVSLGHVAAGIAHEIRNPLSGINIHLSTLKRIFYSMDEMDLNLRGKAEKIFTQLQAASGRIEMVIRKVMDFAKPGQPKLVKTDINEALVKAMDLSAVTLRKSGIQMEQILGDDVPLCKADSHLLEQVILNLITNGAQAMKNMKEHKRIMVSSLCENNHIVVRVADSGPGVPESDRNKIFDPFFTTKSDSSGIGLSLSHRIITDHGGTLVVGTSQWGGAEFTIELPIESKVSG